MSTQSRRSADHPYLSVVIPCFNEQEGLGELHRRVSETCKQVGKPYEVILVNDGSRDATWRKMEELCHLDGHVIAVNLSRNHGHQLALTAGLTVCRGDRILIIDADLQDPPELLPRMLAVMDTGADVVYGQRRRRAGESRFKLATAMVFYRLLERLTDVAIPRDTGDFRLMSRRALDVLLSMPERHRFVRGMVSWIGFRQEPVLYDRDARFAGETNYPLRRMVRLAIDAITGFSIRPLRFGIELGLLTALLAIILLVFSVGSWFVGWNVHGWTSLVGAVCLLGSVQLVMLGIMGEYVGRLYEQSKQRPLFIIERIYRGDSSTAESPGEAFENRETSVTQDVLSRQ
jgi:dolichol-phosphate mannosyltransferase